VLLFLGSTPNKNLNRAIQAVRDIPCRLHIVGIIPPEEEQKLAQYGIAYTNSLNLTEKELADAYSSADVLLFPTLYEGFGLPIIEAQKAGRAVLTSNQSPMKEVAGNGACLVDPMEVQSIREGIEKIIQNNDYREDLIKKGFENVKRFESEAIAAQYLRLYKEIANPVS
jgi:glycosyltransferase involved in cell wall biosynthesis